MTRLPPPLATAMLPLALLAVYPAVIEAQHTNPVRIRPTTLVLSIGELAGRPVHVSGAHVVGMFGPRVLVIDGATRRPAPIGHRDRILVLVESGEMRVAPDVLVGSTVQVSGVARTLLGLQVAGEVPWPPELDRARLQRLEIRAGVLAHSVQTPEGIELTGPTRHR